MWWLPFAVQSTEELVKLGALTYQRHPEAAVTEFEGDASTIPATHMILMMAVMVPIPKLENGLVQG